MQIHDELIYEVGHPDGDISRQQEAFVHMLHACMEREVVQVSDRPSPLTLTLTLPLLTDRPSQMPSNTFSHALSHALSHPLTHILSLIFSLTLALTLPQTDDAMRSAVVDLGGSW